ncbi:MAG TPA: glycosyltransferase family 87 protein [Anaerolineales bacterium]|nr:glycosyltransferase family 87 protein [Anaerolineales bacterium]HLO30149.1 glycosyltransferase family 87 protein [Anaerolineales bacterium]
MAVKKIGGGLIIAGALGLLSAVVAGFLLQGMADIRSIQIFVVEISVMIILCGLWLSLADKPDEIQLGRQIRNYADQMLNFSTLTWVLLGFLLVYTLLFITPIFLNPNLRMNYFTRYIPNLNPIGNDLIVMIDQIKAWVATNQSPYQVQFYPPLTYIIFTPLLLIKDYLRLYRLFVLFTLFNYCLLTLLLPLKVIDKKNLSLALFLFITGLFSYGLQFEIERGQYNVFTFLLCMASIYIFHYHRKYRLIAYLLFSLSVQLKLYPAIFIVMFVDDWQGWKNLALRFVGIGLFNLLLFFAMGYQIFWDFIRSVTAQIVNPSWIGPWNHSISSFISMVKQDGLGLISFETLRVLRHNSGWIEAFLILVYILIFISALIIFHSRKEAGVDPYLLITCTIGAMILPISYDYTLSILPVPLLLFLCGISEMKNAWHKLISSLSILGISIAYSSTLIPYNYRPHFLNNIFPSLFLILVLVTILNFMRYKNNKVQPIESESAV